MRTLASAKEPGDTSRPPDLYVRLGTVLTGQYKNWLVDFLLSPSAMLQPDLHQAPTLSNPPLKGRSRHIFYLFRYMSRF
ncbi:unnamed protein product [Protopolystoma xenopodis]|uniref:Uncharacterized protein n=1 Tax=Protopolystoma xenopodis TaxID=117903 RepID=A0A448WU95_9PLAT|nr:unnamed protein product [Protopolystoma xenopodis]